MLCSKCGKTNEPNTLYCTFCNAPMGGKEEIDITEIEDYESNRGFSRPNTKYIEPEVIDSSNNIETKPSSIHHKQQPDIKQDFYQEIYQERKPDLIREGNQEQLVQNKQRKKKKKKKKNHIWMLLFLAVSILVFVALLIFLVKYKEKAKEYSKVDENVIEVFADEVDRTTYIFNSKGDLLNKVNDFTFPVYNQDHTAAILNDIDYVSNSYGSTLLYYASATNLVELNTMKSFALSEDGMHVLYATDGGLNKEFLYAYHVQNDQNELIDKVENKRYAALTIGREGEGISYTTMKTNNPLEDFSLRELETYIAKTGEKPKLWGKDIAIMATSTDGKYVYYCDFIEGLMTFYVKQGEQVTKLSNSIGSPVFFNRDYSEILFNDGDGTYISINGQEKQKVSDTFVKMILMPQNRFMPTQIGNGICSLHTSTFQNKIIFGEDNSIQLIGNDYRSKELGIGNDLPSLYPVLSEDENNLIYSNQEMELWRVNDLNKECKQELIVDWVNEFEVSNDGSKVYYLKEESLFYHNGKDETKLAEGVVDFCMNRLGDTIFFIKDVSAGSGVLYYSRDGKEPKPVKGAEAVTAIAKWNAGVIYETFQDGVYSVFYNMEGTEFEFILDGVDMIK